MDSDVLVPAFFMRAVEGALGHNAGNVAVIFEGDGVKIARNGEVRLVTEPTASVLREAVNAAFSQSTQRAYLSAEAEKERAYDQVVAEYEANVSWYRANVNTLDHGKWYCVSKQAIFDGPRNNERDLGERADERNLYPSEGALVVCAGVSTLEPLHF